MQTVRYYGWYSNKMRGQRAAESDEAGEGVHIDAEQTPASSESRMRWAALIKSVFEVDSLKCPECGGKMKIVAFIERRDQADVIERMLKHCGLWQPPASRSPPEPSRAPEHRRQSTLQFQQPAAE